MIESKKHPKVFLSYSKADSEVASKVMSKLRKEGIKVWYAEVSLKPGDSIVEAIEDSISASDYLVVLLSPNSVKSKWVRYELSAALHREFSSRAVTVLPVLIKKCRIPSLLSNRVYVDLSEDFEMGLIRLVKQINVAPDIDFSELDAKSFQELIIDLLKARGFKWIKREYRLPGEKHIALDLVARYSRKDPFDFDVVEHWIVEIKFYRKSRLDIHSITQLTKFLTIFPKKAKGLLVTNGQITSIARSYVTKLNEKENIDITVLEGTDLKRLLLQHSNLITKYFTVKANRYE